MSEDKKPDAYNDDLGFGDKDFFTEVDTDSLNENKVTPESDFDNNFSEVVVEDTDFFSDSSTTNLFSNDDEISEQQKRNFEAFRNALTSGEVDINSLVKLPGVKLEQVDAKGNMLDGNINPLLENVKEITPGQSEEDFFELYKDKGIRKSEDGEPEGIRQLPEFNAIELPKNAFATPQTVSSSFIINNFVGKGKRELTPEQREELSLYQLINRFRFITDNNPSFKGFSVSGKYDFDNYPLIQFEEGFACVLEPKLLVRILVTLCDSMRLPSLHACQLGLKYDVFVVKINREQYAEFFNAELLGVSESGNKEPEICGSYPGLSFKIERPNYVEVTYLDSNAEEKEHQIDEEQHARYFIQNWALTRGRTMFDFITPLTKAMGLKKREKLKLKIEGKTEYETY